MMEPKLELERFDFSNSIAPDPFDPLIETSTSGHVSDLILA